MFNLSGYKLIEYLGGNKIFTFYRGENKNNLKPCLINIINKNHQNKNFSRLIKKAFELHKKLNPTEFLNIYTIKQEKDILALICSDADYIPLRLYSKKFVDFKQSLQPDFIEFSQAITLLLSKVHQLKFFYQQISPDYIFVNPLSKKIKLFPLILSIHALEETKESFKLKQSYWDANYISPEQTDRINHPIDYRSDFYSLGIIFYELVTERLPFPVSKTAEKFHHYLAIEPIPAKQYNLDLPQMMNDIITKLMAKKPQERYQTSVGLLHDLNLCQQSWEQMTSHIILGQKDIKQTLALPAANSKQISDNSLSLANSSVVEPDKLVKIIQLYLAEKYSEVLQLYKKIRLDPKYFKDELALAEYTFYYCLSLTASYQTASITTQKKYWQELQLKQVEIENCLNKNRKNFLFKYLLIKAEIARISRQFDLAKDLYKKAITLEQKFQFPLHQALGNELLAQFYLNNQQLDLAQPYAQKAYQIYQSYHNNLLPWRGATDFSPNSAWKIKQKRIEDRYKISNQKSTKSLILSASKLDINNIIKGSQFFLQEIKLENLMTRILEVVLQNFGAETVYLIPVSPTSLVARGKIIAGKITCDLFAYELDWQKNNLPQSIIEYVCQTKELVVLNYPFTSDKFAQDIYLKNQSIKSILCLPILQQDRLTNLLYLENKLFPQVFTPSRIEVLQIFSAQAAIALENARLYRLLEKKVEQCRSELATVSLERQRIIQALQFSEEKFAKVFRSSPDPMSISTLESGEIIEVNQSFLQLFQFELEEVIGYTAEELKIWVDIDARKKIVKQLNYQSKLHNQEIQLRAKSGRILTILISAELIELGEQICLVSNLKDITERKEKEESLQLILAGTAVPIGTKFFQVCVHSLTKLLQVEACLITEVIDHSSGKVKTLAFWQRGKLRKNIEYSISNNPCSQILQGIFCKYPAQLAETFPHSWLVKDLQAESYLGMPILGSQGEVLGHIGVFDRFEFGDIAENQELILKIFAARAGAELERQRSATKLAQHEQFLRNVLDANPELIYVKDKQGKFILANQAFADIYGLKVEEIVGKTHQQLPAKLNMGEIFPSDQIIKDNQTINLETSLKEKEKIRWFKVIKKPLVVNQNEQFEYILTVATDITDRKLAETKLARQFKKAQLIEKITQDIRQSLDSNTIFRTTVESIGTTLQVSRCLLFTRSLTGEVQAIEYRDQLVSSVLGSELINSTGFNLEKIILPEKVMAIANVYNELHSHKANSLHQQLQIKSILAVRTSYLGSGNGLIVLHQCDRYREWTIEDKELLEVVANQVGIAIAQAKLLETEKEQSKELNRKNQDLAQAKQEAEIASLAKSEFLANVSHELRTPLNAILGFSQLMSRDTNLHLKQRETLNIINSSGEHLLKLINDVLEMSRIEAGRETLEIRDFDLQKLLVSLYQMLRLKAQAKRLELIFDCSSQVPQYIKTDEHKLRQILTNLITNGIKFTERGKVSLNVSLKSTTNLSQSPILHFAVTDTGIGIQPAEMAQLFEAFVQTQAGKKAKQGTGLGLAISRKFAQLLGSDIKVKSQWLSGSTFSFDLPVELGNPSEIPTQITETVIGLQPGQTNYRILIVEDIAESRTLLVELLKSIGFQVKAAKNGLEAVNLSADWLPHLIWMDMRMPLMDGYQATRLIKNQAKKMQLSPPVIIALTASALKDKVLDSISAGCDDFVHKPFKENVIFSKMEKYLGVKYLYANSGKLPSKTTNNFCHPQTRKLQQKPQELNLTHLSLAWRENLKQAAIALDETTIKQLISDIKNEHFAIAESLRKLVQKCRFDLIIELIEQSLNQPQ